MAKRTYLGPAGHLLLTASTYLFLWLPILVLLTFSFNSEVFPAPWKSFTFKWYVELIHSVYLWKAFVNSLIIAFSSTFISILMGILLIFFVAQDPIPGGRFGKYLNLFYGSIIIPETVLGVSLLGFFGLASISLGLATLIVGHTILGLGFVIPLVYARYLELDGKLIEASLALGATPLQTFFRITLPQLKPSLIASGLLVFIISFDDFILTYFCSGSSTQTLSLYILSMIRSGISPVMNALSALLLFISSIFVMIYFHLSTRGKVFL